MPTPLMKSLQKKAKAKGASISMKKMEEYWGQAKADAAKKFKEGSHTYWAYVVGILKKRVHNKELQLKHLKKVKASQCLARLSYVVTAAQKIDGFDAKFETFLEGCKAIAVKNNPKAMITVDEGPKYMKLAISTIKDDPHRSAFAFVDKTNGNVLKPDGWKAPAKGSRGNIFKEDNGLSRIGPYGAR